MLQMFLRPVLLKRYKEMEIAGHDIGTDWTVVHNLLAVQLLTVKIRLAVWVLVLPCKMTNISHNIPGLLQRMFHCNLQSVPQKHLTFAVPPVKQGWFLFFRCLVINSNFISCNKRCVSVTTARNVFWVGI